MKTAEEIYDLYKLGERPIIKSATLRAMEEYKNQFINGCANEYWQGKQDGWKECGKIVLPIFEARDRAQTTEELFEVLQEIEKARKIIIKSDGKK